MPSTTDLAIDKHCVPADVSPIVASLLAGHHMARVYFHMQQAALLGSSYDPPQLKHDIKDANARHHTLARDAVKAIQQLTYSMSLEGAQKQGLRETIDRIVHEWGDTCCQDNLLSRVDAANEEFSVRPYDSGWGDLCHEVIEDFVIPYYSRIREQLFEALHDDDIRAFELGECIEQGLCRPDIYRHLHNTGSRFILPTEFLTGDPEEEEELEVVASGDIVGSPESDGDFGSEVIADTSWEPGQLLPDDRWFGELPIVWERACTEPLESPQFRTMGLKMMRREQILRAELVSTVEALHSNACRKLTALNAEVQSLASSHWKQTGHYRERTVGKSQTDDDAVDTIETEEPQSVDTKECEPLLKIKTQIDATDRGRLLAIKREIDPDGRYIGSSNAILMMFERIYRCNKTANRPILVLGPSGAGKNDLAELIHKHSRRTGGFHIEHATATMYSDFGIVNTRWEGYTANSGISNTNPKGQSGLLETYHGGTIFVDELHACTKEFQTFLLRVIDDAAKPDSPDPSHSPRRDVRLIFASSRDLEGLERDILPDLMRRLRSWVVEVPPLRDRKDDIPLFVDRLLGARKRSDRFLLALLRYDWPGQVGELVDTLTNAESSADGEDSLDLQHLEFRNSAVVDDLSKLEDSKVERELYRTLASILNQQGFRKGTGLQRRMAEILGKSESTVTRKVLKHLDKSDLA